MEITMRHLSVESILDQIENKAANADSRTTAEHLQACRKCSTKTDELRELLAFMSTDASNEPSPATVQWGVELFQPVIRPALGQDGLLGPVRRIAKLVFDSFEQPLTAGVRAGVMGIESMPRQLLFRAGEVDVDVRIESGADNRISLSGQVLSEAVPFFENTQVRLESHGVARYKTSTNPVGEFSFDEVPQDTYHLSMDLPEGQVTLFCVYRRESVLAS
jgi:hypothetical protein